MSTKYMVVSVGGTGDLEPETIYGLSEPPEFATRAEAQASAEDLKQGLADCAPDAEFEIVELDT